MASLRVGIVGAGFMGEVHARAWQRIRLASTGSSLDVELCAIADVELGGRTWLAEFPWLKKYESASELVRAGDVDVVDVCVPTPAHREVVEIAASGGKAVLCEKPLAASVREAQQIAECVARYGVPFMTAHVVRFFPEYVTARETALSGEIGIPRYARAFRGGAKPAWSPWLGDRMQSGGVILDTLVHDFDYLRWLFGEVRRVSAISLRHGPEGRDHAVVVLRFENDAIAQVEGAWSYPQGSPFRTELEIAGTDGLIQYSSDEVEATRVWSQGARPGDSRYPVSPLDPDPYQLEIEHFASHVLRGTPLRISVEDAVAAVAIAEAAIRASETCKPVVVRT